MNLNISLEGRIEDLVNRAINQGLVKTKSEIIRAGILLFAKEYGLNEPSIEEVNLVNRKIEEEMQEIRSGKVKTIPLSEIEKKYGLA
jgi:Arc/MetJ-type ribon-helix-helix transcriptional regulator